MLSLHVYENHSVLPNGELSFPINSQWSKPKMLIYTNVYLCAKFGELKPEPTIDEM